jgi:hypothetical protein
VSALGQLPDVGGNIWLRVPRGYQLLEFAFALSRCGRKPLSVIILREMRQKEHEPSQMDASVGQKRVRKRKPPHQSGSVHALVRDVLTHAESRHAEVEETRAGLLAVELTTIDFAEVEKQLGVEGVFTLKKVSESEAEFLVGQSAKFRSCPTRGALFERLRGIV